MRFGRRVSSPSAYGSIIPQVLAPLGWVSVEVLKFNNEVAGFIYGVVGVLYAVLLGFKAIIVWEQFDKAHAGVDQEANELADLYRDAQAFPDDTRRGLETQLRAYAKLVVEKEWPAMAETDVKS